MAGEIMTASLDNNNDLVHTGTPLVSSNGCVVSLYENVITNEDADALLEDLSRSLPWNVEEDNFGPQSRATCYFGDPECVFSYVGLRLEPRAWTESLKRLKTLVVKACKELGNDSLLTACLANEYKDGEGYIPWHYDEVRAHGDSKIVASLSLGGPRRFQLRSRKDQTIVVDLLLPSGSVLFMNGKTQEHYEHCLPLSVLTDDANNIKNPRRISLTFRSIVPGYETKRELARDVCCTSNGSPY
jgi:alkylated DNA repair dioxygenase AlkB